MLIDNDFKKRLITWIALIILSLTYFLLMYFLTNWNISNICLIPACLCLGYVALRWITRFGTFDVFAYQFSTWFQSFKKGMPKKYESAYEYKEHIQEVRSNNNWIYLPYIIVGSIFLILCIVLSFYPSLGR